MTEAVQLELVKNLGAILFACTGLLSVAITLIGAIVKKKLDAVAAKTDDAVAKAIENGEQIQVVHKTVNSALEAYKTEAANREAAVLSETVKNVRLDEQQKAAEKAARIHAETLERVASLEKMLAVAIASPAIPPITPVEVVVKNTPEDPAHVRVEPKGE